MNSQRIFLLFTFFLFSCVCGDGKNFKKKNIQADLIKRADKDALCWDQKPRENQSLLYPFEDKLSYFTITGDFFRCKGNPLNPKRIDSSDARNIRVYSDCEGSTKHGLFLINSKEGVYPILIELLNYIQKKTNRKVVITCGHRCPKHNAYADILNDAKSSKHMIGAEVDFYVQGLEQNPNMVVDIILKYYNENPKYKGKQEFAVFKRFQESADVSAEPWFNKEIFIKIYQADEGRDFDNRHPYPYVCVQVIWDSNAKENVTFNMDRANKGYLR